ncbi:MAG: TAT-variant-translocated molybdopterin oxidoreductase [Cytophagaceae bacterium]|nr:TAT-variant-translocated molybdopterin oxidoreductase [Cytophagaceae bacterium]
MENKKTYWRGVEELTKDPEFLKHAYSEFPEFVPVKEQSGSEGEGTNRRDFLKLLGFGIGAVSLAACEAPVKKAIPYLDKPEEVEPGIANYYASTFVDGGDYCSILVKTREGRPIKIEGNKLSPVSAGGTSARVQASVLSLYDSGRTQSFLKAGATITKEKADAEIIAALAGASQIRIVSQTILSPSTKAVIAQFKEKYPSTVHIQYDPSSASGILDANKQSFGKRVLPSYDFSKAKTIVSIGADFLGTWISPVEFSKQFAAGRKLNKSKKEMSRLYAFESNLSLTGSNADYREPVLPSQEGLVALSLLKLVSGGTSSIKSAKLKKASDDLLANKGASLVVAGSNDVNVQIIVNEINKVLGNYGTTVDINTPSYYRQGDDAEMNKFVDELKAKSIDAVLFLNANPVYDHPRGAEIKQALGGLKLSVSFNDRKDETSELCTYLTPDNHYLESWGDAMPKKGQWSLIQPTINAVYGTRQAQESLLIWAGASNTNFGDFVASYWNANVLSGASFNKALHDGVFSSASSSEETSESSTADISAAEAAVLAVKAGGLEAKLYEKVGMGWGSQAGNPWLQEFPDPISKATWDNYVAVPASYASANGLKQGSVVTVKANGKEISLPVLIQPGQAANSVSIALGYGRKISGRPKEVIGVNAFALASATGSVSYNLTNVTITPTGEFREIAQTQTHDTIMDRPVVQETTLAQFLKDPMKHRFQPMITTPDGKKKPHEVSLWVKEHEKPNHLWQMAIDLNSCIGCGACVISCQAENNVPVVGRDEVIRRREMHWIRIDRYYSSDAETKEEGKYFGSNYDALEVASDNPQVVFMPMLCQHCNHAPCETVCPVAATTHSSEGLNQMAYNRCFGTRYCANNCPYKVRRFNWFKYFDNEERFPENISMNTEMGRMVLNPDVTVRSRGVMEKCSMCVQRIQEGKLAAKKAKTAVKDGAINVACATACPTDAIVFGDVNDQESRVYKEKMVENKERAYAVLEELNVQPNIHYLSKIRNNEA